MKKEFIPLSVPSLKGNELKYLRECIKTEWVSTAGRFVNEFEKECSKFTGSKYSIACINGTSAIHISLKLAGVKSGDEVIVPTLTFIAPVNAIIYNNACPIFMDSDSFFNIDINKTLEFLKKNTIFKNGITINKKTKKKISAIIVVNVWGNGIDLDELTKICKKKNIRIIEDSSEALGTFIKIGKFRGRHAGTNSFIGCLSFNGNKIITAGGGGMIMTDKKKIAEKAKYLISQAKDDAFNFVHNEIGYNFKLNNLQSAVGLSQMEQLNKFIKKKRYINKKYNYYLKNSKKFYISETPSISNNNYWINILRFNSKNPIKIKNKLIQKFKINKIETRPVWKLNHLQKPFKTYQRYKISNAIKLFNSSLCLPSSVSLSSNKIKRIVDVING